MEADQEAADGEALGIDLSRYFKRTEFMFYKEQIKERIKELVTIIEDQEKRLRIEVSLKGEEYSKGVTIIESRLEDHMKPVREDIAILLKTRARQESDDMLKQKAIIMKFEQL